VRVVSGRNWVRTLSQWWATLFAALNLGAPLHSSARATAAVNFTDLHSGKYLVQMSVGAQTILREVFRISLQYLHANDGIVPQIGHGRFISSHSKLFRYSP
jgi:hypothetical protein